MKIETKALEIGFKFGAMATAIKLASFWLIAMLLADSGVRAAGLSDVSGSDFNEVMSLSVEQSVRVFAFYFFSSICIYAIHKSKITASPWVSVVMFLGIPFAFMYVPGVLSDGGKYSFWGASALIVMMIYAGHNGFSPRMKWWFYLFVLAFIAYGNVYDIYNAWSKVVYQLADRLGTNPNPEFYFAIPALMTAGVLYFLHVYLVKIMVKALVKDEPVLSLDNLPAAAEAKG